MPEVAMMTELTERQRAILAAADATREARNHTLTFNRYDTSRAANDAWSAFSKASAALARAAIQDDDETVAEILSGDLGKRIYPWPRTTTTNGCEGGASDE